MSYQVEPQRTGIVLFYRNRRIGGWNINEKHLYVVGSFARVANRVAVLERHGFKPMRHGSGYRWWRLPESELAAFRAAVEEILGERLRLR